MMVDKKICLLLSLLIGNIAFSQKSDVFSPSKSTKYQIGIGASKFVNNLFPSDKNAFLIEARIRKNENVHYRFGADYEVDNSKNGNYKAKFKIGLDKLFKTYNRWIFYYGIDIGYSHNYLKVSKTHTGSILLSPFFGILYKINKNFSLSTEPNLYLATNFLINNKTFKKDNKDVWLESGFSKIGFLQLNFHF